MKTVLVGKFQNGVMMSARSSKIIAERCNNGIKEIIFSKHKPTNPILSCKRNTNHRIHDPTIMDPFEKNMVYVDKTLKAGEGLFAKKDIDANQLIVYYSGTIWSPQEYIFELSPANQTGYFR